LPLFDPIVRLDTGASFFEACKAAACRTFEGSTLLRKIARPSSMRIEHRKPSALSQGDGLKRGALDLLIAERGPWFRSNRVFRREHPPELRRWPEKLKETDEIHSPCGCAINFRSPHKVFL